jgi:hypothetical protein
MDLVVVLPMDALDARMNDFETSLKASMKTLNDNQHKLSTAYSGLQSGVPSIIETLNDTSTVGTMYGTLLTSSAMTDLLSEVCRAHIYNTGLYYNTGLKANLKHD